MQHYPTMHELAALLDEAIDAEHRAVCARLIDAETRYSTVRAVGRSLANAIRTALRNGDVVNSSTLACLNALKQWETHDH